VLHWVICLFVLFLVSFSFALFIVFTNQRIFELSFLLVDDFC
jgi:hypothetical protein